MNDPIQSAVSGIIYGAFQVLANHLNKPKDWKPTVEDIQKILDEVNAATPEARKQAAAKRLGIKR